METTSLFFIIPLVFIIVFPLFWSGVCMLLAAIGGWRMLAKRFANDRTLTGDAFNMRSGLFRFATSYSNIINVVVSFEGISLRVFPLFRPGHAPLIIPWDAVQQVEHGRMLFREVSYLHIRPSSDSSTIRLSLFGKDLAESIQRNAPRFTTGE